MKQRVGRQRAKGGDTVRGQPVHGGGDDTLVLIPELPVFTGMRVKAAESNPRIGTAEITTQGFIEKAALGHQPAGCQGVGYITKRDMHGCRHNAKHLACQHHQWRTIARRCQRRQKFGMARVGKAGFNQNRFMDRIRDHGCRASVLRHVGGDTDSLDDATCVSWIGFAGNGGCVP